MFLGCAPVLPETPFVVVFGTGSPLDSARIRVVMQRVVSHPILRHVAQESD